MTKDKALELIKEQYCKYDADKNTVIDSISFDVGWNSATDEAEQVISAINNWNNYKENKPNKMGNYLCCTKPISEYDHKHIDILYYYTEKGDLFDSEWKGAGFYSYISEYGEIYQDDMVLAWTDLPEGYNE